jgi:glycosyltransferase involved in cell wall biosynthesis
VKILTALTYYHPHWTGLTAIAKRIAEGLAARGHEVTVLTTRHAEELPEEEEVGGVRVVRLRQIGRLSRGLVAPGYPWAAAKAIRESDVVQIHTPLMECLLVAALARRTRTPLLMTHQGDLVMPSGLLNQGIERIGTAMLRQTARLATQLTTHNADYIPQSTVLAPFAHKTHVIYPPVELPEPGVEASRWRSELGLDDKRVVGFAGRFVEEKGFDYLLRAVPALRASEPNVHLVFAGEHRIAYETFYERCRPLVEAQRDRITFLGLLHDPQKLAAFYGLCDVFALPSRTDCMPSVQLEAMLCGTPVVATDIPGAREPVRLTGMGKLVAPHDPKSLAEGLLDVLGDPASYTRPPEEIRRHFDPARSIDRYEQLLGELAGAR